MRQNQARLSKQREKAVRIDVSIYTDGLWTSLAREYIASEQMKLCTQSEYMLEVICSLTMITDLFRRPLCLMSPLFIEVVINTV
jgi:hypothetical protein